MSDPLLPVTVAWQGITLRLPADTDVAATYGNWRSGHLILARDRAALLRVSWERRREVAELEPTLAQAAKRVRRETGCSALPGIEDAGADGGVIRCQGRTAELAVGARRFADATTTVVWRQLMPAPVNALVAMVRAANAVGDDGPTTWQIHGLTCSLPPWWRVEGVQALAGLARGVWFRYPNGRRGADQVLVVRRMACAGRVIGERTLEGWLRTTLHADETATVVSSGDDQVELACARPARSWWRRWRGQFDRRIFTAWRETESDRVTVQEWAGSGEPPECLRHATRAQGSGLFNARSSA